MLVYILDALRSKDGEFEAQGKHPKLFTRYSIDKEQSRDQLGLKFGYVLEEIHPTINGRVTTTIAISSLFLMVLGISYQPPMVGPTLPSQVVLHWTLKLQILNRGTSNQRGDLGRDLDPILQAQEDSYQLVSENPPFEGQIDLLNSLKFLHLKCLIFCLFEHFPTKYIIVCLLWVYSLVLSWLRSLKDL
ncbi:hypothetical protein M9H77_18675 [Catharanthus roseus]|uniref:Uncharacterized protein n=1 Tax=Catharanthus roseus TaxID=4058 RepID=A0ACC0B825_CATRO|nr:hypothetical protein M9H77_18675 [Catharanthus roseus]